MYDKYLKGLKDNMTSEEFKKHILNKPSFPVTLAEKLSVISPFTEEEIQKKVINFFVLYYNKELLRTSDDYINNKIDESHSIIIEKSTKSINLACSKAISLEYANVEVL